MMSNKPFEIPKLIISKPMKNPLKEDSFIYHPNYGDTIFGQTYTGEWIFKEPKPKMNPDGTIKEEYPDA